MRTPPKAAPFCSFCEKIIEGESTEVLAYQFHRQCADQVAEVLGKIRSFNQWKKDHPKWQTSELVA